MTVPTIEPPRVTAGDTLAWTRSLPDYPASAGWVLHYRLINAAGKIDIIASAAGDDHAVNVAASTSATWTAGTYTRVAHVVKGSERHTVGTGEIIVDPDLAAAVAGADTRSDARIILDSLLASYRIVAASHAYVQRYEVNGRVMQFNAKADWIKEINFWKQQVAKESRARRRAEGLSVSTKTYVSF